MKPVSRDFIINVFFFFFDYFTYDFRAIFVDDSHQLLLLQITVYHGLFLCISYMTPIFQATEQKKVAEFSAIVL